MKNWYYLLIIFVSLIFGKVNIVSSTTDLADIAKTVGGDRVKVITISRGNQDPHFVEVLPSYMIKVKKADIYLKVGMELDLWSTQIIAGSRNKNIKIVDCSQKINALEVPTGKVDASLGDIHTKGNPHYWLDPENGKLIAETILDELVNFDPAGRDEYQLRFDRFIQEVDDKMARWVIQYENLNEMNILLYHNSWPYFSERFGLHVVEFIEPKPGIMPTPSHLDKLINIIHAQQIACIGVGPYYSMTAPNYLEEKTGIKVIRLAPSVGSNPEADTYLNMIHYNLESLEKLVEH